MIVGRKYEHMGTEKIYKCSYEIKPERYVMECGHSWIVAQPNEWGFKLIEEDIKEEIK